MLDAEEVDARHEARGIVGQAQQEAAQIRAQAQEEREQVYREAREAGRQAGLAEMAGVIAKAKLDWGDALRKSEPEIVRLALRVAERIIGAELQTSDTTILHIVAKAVDQLRQNKELVLRLNPADAEILRRDKRQLLEAIGRLKDIGFKDDPRVRRGGCVIETENGTVDAQLSTQLEMLEETLLGMDHPAEPTAPMAIELSRYIELLKEAPTVRVRGRVTELTGLVVRAAVPGARVGEVVTILGRKNASVRAEVVGFQGEEVMLMPLGELVGIGPDSEVVPSGRPLTIQCGEGLLGRVLGGLGDPIDGRPLPPGMVEWSVDRAAPDPFTRKRIEKPLSVGIRSIDGLLTMGEGQRIGMFAGSGVGKSTLMGQIARQVNADLCVVALIGERGREVREFVEDSLGVEGLRRSVVVCATSDQPALVRLRAAYVATSIAEYFRDRGGNVLFMLDTVTRLARAQREIGLAVGEPPARQGYPPSVFSMLPRILERTGNSHLGVCSAIYTVLVAGGDMEEPIADEVRGILDGHFILDRALGERNHWPALNVLPSLSRVMNQVVGEDHRQAAQRLRETLAQYEKQRDLIALGAYQYGNDPKTDYAIDKIEAIEAFLKQGTGENTPLEETAAQLIELFADA